MSFRTRLSALFVLTMTALVVATSVATYLVVRSSLRSNARGKAVTLAKSAGAIEEPQEVSLDRIAGPGTEIWLTNSRGAVVAQSYSSSGAASSIDAIDSALRAAPAGSTSARWPRSGGGYAIVLLTNRAIDSSLSTLLSTLLVVGITVIAASAVLGILLAWRALEPVERMRRQADAIPGDQLHRRLSEGRPDELGRLAAAFNRLLARAERATVELQRFVADASHELRTPVTALQGHARIAVRAAEREDVQQVRESAGIVAAESERLARTLTELLSLADAESAEPTTGDVRLDLIADAACDELHAVHPGRRIDRRLSEVTVTGDGNRLGELIRILIDNALKYSPPDQPVVVTVTGSPAEPARLSVSDHGPGLSAEDRRRAFDRFYRGAASRGVEGSGLGLAIAHTIAERHSSVLRLADRPGGGTVADVVFTTNAVPQ